MARGGTKMRVGEYLYFLFGADQYPLSHRRFVHALDAIAAWAKEKGFEKIYGIPRGGMSVAQGISYRTNIPVVLNQFEITAKTLVVDDITDGGERILLLEREVGCPVWFATVYYNKDTKRMPDFSCYRKILWVRFPLETKESSKYDGTLS